jgi:DNA polymerase III epsilon subunit-like protein
MEHVIVFDSETTGLSPTRNGIVALGAIDPETGDTFYEECRIDDDTEINPYALQVNGFTEAQVRDPNKETQAELIQHFEAWCKAHNATVLSGYNVNFDIRFLKGAARKNGIAWGLPIKYADVEQIYMKEIFTNPDFDDEINKYLLRTGEDRNVKGVKMDHALESLDIGKEPRPHNALTGATYCAELLSLMEYGRHVTPAFDSYKIIQKLKKLQVDIAPHIRDIDLTKETEDDKMDASMKLIRVEKRLKDTS